VSPLRIGIWATVVVAGPPLYLAVDHGDMTSGGAAARAVVIALACAVGASFVLGLVSDYETEARKAEDKYLAKALLEQLAADRAKAEAAKREGTTDRAGQSSP
jgi:hypothetical protein